MTNVKEIILSLHLEQFSGKLSIKKDQVEKNIFFRKGIPIFVDSTIRNETLGQLLLEQGKLTEEQYRNVIERMEQTKRRQGELIVELGYLSGFEVYQALQMQGGRKLENTFLLEGADVTSEEGEKYLLGVLEIPIDLFRVYMDATFATYGPGENLPFSDAQAFTVNEKGKKYLGTQSLKPNESKIFRLLDGKRNFSQMIETSGVDPDEAMVFLSVLKSFAFLQEISLPPQRFTMSKSQLAQIQAEQHAKEKESERKIVEIKNDPAPPASPIYAIALKLERPYHEILGVEMKANRFQAKKRYEEIVRELHLDFIDAHYNEKDRRVAEQVFDRLTLAMTVFVDDKRKHEYYQSLAKAKKGPIEQPSTAILAEVAIQKGKMQLAKKQFEKAEVEIRKAIDLAPKDPSYHIELAELLIQKAASEKKSFPDAIEQELRQALTLNNAEFRAFYQLGIYYKLKGDTDRARNCFQKTLEIKKDHPQASTELRLIHRRMEEKQKGTSTFMKLFKKKDGEKEKSSKDGDDD